MSDHIMMCNVPNAGACFVPSCACGCHKSTEPRSPVLTGAALLRGGVAVSEYTPKTHEIRAAAVNHRAPVIHRQMFGQTIRDAERVALAEFDRWLAEVERAAAEKAWAEGVATALNYAKREPDGITLKLVTLDGGEWENPYRRNEGENHGEMD